MKNEYLESICATEESWRSASAADQELAGAYIRGQEKGLGMIIFDHFPNRGFEDLIATMHRANVNEIYYSGDWSNALERYLALDELGLKLRGIVRVENPKYKKDMARYGYCLERESFPALRFSFKEE